MLNTEQLRRLESLSNRSTAYEIVLISPAGERRLVTYAQNRSGRALRLVLVRFAERIVAFVGADEYTLAGRGPAPIGLGNGYSLAFSGRTERESIIAGELERLP